MHDELTEGPKDDNGKQLQYFSPSEPVTEKLKTLVLDSKWLKSLSYYIKFRYAHNQYYMYMYIAEPPSIDTKHLCTMDTSNYSVILLF